MYGRSIILALKLAAGGGVDRAAVLTGGNELAEAGIAAQALVYLICLAHSRLVRQVGVGNNASAYFDNVYKTIRKSLFHHGRVAERTDSRNGRLDILLDLSGKFHIDAVLKEHRGVHDDERLDDLMVADRAMDDIAVTVKLLCAFNAVFDTIADGVDLGCRHTEVDHKVLAADLFDSVADHDRKPASVLCAAAPFVGAVIGERAHKLMEQPAMAAVMQNHFEACKLNTLCRLCVKLNSI